MIYVAAAGAVLPRNRRVPHRRHRFTPIARFGHMRRIVGDVAAGRAGAAADRIRFAAGFLNPIAAEQDGRTQ